MLFAVSNITIVKWSMVLLLCLCGDVSSRNPYKNGEVHAGYPKGCAYLRCKRGDQCVNRKFWCKNPPCPSMMYCSKTRKESLKGPSSCEAVRCSKGFVCLVRTRHCRWGEACEQQIARCISERDYYEGPATCADFRCPSGHRCILRESLCAKAPCKLLKSCANAKDVNSWFEGCKSLGCLSEYECFLRRPDDNCTKAHCKHTPDCLAKSEEELAMNEHCRGWVCPRGQECSSHTEGPCMSDSCRMSRSCHKPMMVPANSTRPRKHSWKDDTKLNFRSKFEKAKPVNNNPIARLSTDKKISRESGAMGNTEIPTNTAIGKIRERPIYKSPVYVTANARPMSSEPRFASPTNTSGDEIQPTVTSLSTWLNHLKLKTGVDAIGIWIRKADEQEGYAEFIEWLESVKDMLGTVAYDLWLEEVRAMTVTSPAFQKWLPPDTRNSAQENGNPTNSKNNGPELDSRLANSTKFQPNEDHNFSHRDDIVKEDSFIFPPRAESPTTMPHIFPTIANEWSRFYPPNLRIYQQTYPFNPNIGNIPPWSNQVTPFRDFDPTALMNPWYQQYPRNWSFQTPVHSSPDILLPDPRAWQDRFVPPPNHQHWQQERGSHDRYSMDRRIESARSSTDIPPFLGENPFPYYSRNSPNEDTSWMKYFFNPYQTSELIRASSFGNFPINDENFDGYPSRPGFDGEGRSNADVPHRRSKHEDSTINLGHFRYGNIDEDGTKDKLYEMPEDAVWPIVDPRLEQYYRYLIDYNKINRKENQIVKDPSPTTITPGLVRFHRVDVERSSQLPNRYFPDSARGLPRPEYRSPNYYKQDLPIEFDRRGFLFGNQPYESPLQTMGLPDLWNPRYRTPLSSIVHRVDGERLNERDTMEKIVPVVSPRKRVSPNWIAPIASEESHYEEDDDYREDEKHAEFYPVDDEEEMHPLLFSLQGYIESPDEESWQHTKNSSSTSMILPVYTSDNDARGQDDCMHYYSGSNDDAADDKLKYHHEIINLFKNPKYGGNPDFPNYLKSVLEAEAAMIMRNATGTGDVEIEGIKWEYEDDENEKVAEDSSRFADRQQKSISPSSRLPNINNERDSVANTKEGRSDDSGSENYYYDDGIDYAERSYSNLEQIDGYGLLNNEGVGDYFTNRFYDDPDHKRFKKNRFL